MFKMVQFRSSVNVGGGYRVASHIDLGQMGPLLVDCHLHAGKMQSVKLKLHRGIAPSVFGMYCPAEQIVAIPVLSRLSRVLH